MTLWINVTSQGDVTWDCDIVTGWVSFLITFELILQEKIRTMIFFDSCISSPDFVLFDLFFWQRICNRPKEPRSLLILRPPLCVIWVGFCPMRLYEAKNKKYIWIFPLCNAFNVDNILLLSRLLNTLILNKREQPFLHTREKVSWCAMYKNPQIHTKQCGYWTMRKQFRIKNTQVYKDEEG